MSQWELANTTEGRGCKMGIPESTDTLVPIHCMYRLAPDSVIRVSEELAAKGTRDEIIWSFYAGLA